MCATIIQVFLFHCVGSVTWKVKSVQTSCFAICVKHARNLFYYISYSKSSPATSAHWGRSVSVTWGRTQTAFMASPCEENKRAKSKTPTANRLRWACAGKTKGQALQLSLIVALFPILDDQNCFFRASIRLQQNVVRAAPTGIELAERNF